MFSLFIYSNHRKFNFPTTGNLIFQPPEIQYSDHRKHNIPTHVLREAFTAVAHHNKTPDFYEEVKIKLPSNLRLVGTTEYIYYHIYYKV